jgi:nucleotide-binding universal stress UspA family protein
MDNLVETADFRQVEPRHSQARALSRDAHAIHQILVCVDDSPFSDACLHQAVAISKGLGSAITLLYVMQPPRERSGLHAPDVLDWEISRQEASAYLERLEKEGTQASGSGIHTRLEQGHPAERIAAVAREIGADLTVLGSRGERGVATGNLGGTVLQVLALTRGSVLIARSSSSSGDASLKRILVPLDGSSRTESVLPTAVRIASVHGAELLLVFVVRDPVPTAVLRAPEDLKAARELATRLEANGKRYLEELRGQLVREGTSVRTLVLRSVDEKQAVLELSLREASDLIVVSAHGSTCNPALTFGGVTAHLLAHSGVPLLVLQDLPDLGVRLEESDLRAPPLRATYPEGV